MLLDPLVGADQSVLFGPPAAEDQAPSRPPICLTNTFFFFNSGKFRNFFLIPENSGIFFLFRKIPEFFLNSGILFFV
jgi:hypothetical protein